MFSRTIGNLARRSQFSNFFKTVNSRIAGSDGAQRMKVAGALWRSTTPRFGHANSKKRSDAALQLYAKHGKSILRKAPAASAKTNASKSSRRKRAAPRKKAVKAATSTKKPATYEQFQRSVRQGSWRRLSPAEQSTLRAVYTATRHVTSYPVRVRLARDVLAATRRSLRRKPKAARRSSSRSRVVKRTPARRRSRQSAQKTKAPASLYQKFHAEVTKRASLTKSKSLNTRIYRLWLLTNSKPELSFQKRVNMAVQLARKRHRSSPVLSRRLRRTKSKAKRSAKKKAVARRRVRKVARSGSKKKTMAKSRRARRAAPRKATKRVVKRRRIAKSPRRLARRLRTKAKSKRSARGKASKRRVVSTKKAPKVAPLRSRKVSRSTGKTRKNRATVKRSSQSRRRNPYVRFYRAVMQTGHVPYSPRKARSKRIKELWNNTRHLNSLQSRIKFAESIVSGEKQPLPAVPKVVVKANARNSVKRAAKATRRPSPVSPAGGGSSINFKVPENYARNPFAAAYSVLGSHAHGADSDARMHTVARAWMASVVSGKDTRSPRDRIEAAARVMRRQ